MQRSILSLPLLAVAILMLSGCGANPQETVKKLEGEIGSYEKSPSPTKKAEIQELFGKLDQQIAELDKKQATSPTDDRASQIAELKQMRAKLMGEFQGSQLTQAVDQAKEALKGVGESISDTIKQAGDELKNALDSPGNQSTPQPSPAE